MNFFVIYTLYIVVSLLLYVGVFHVILFIISFFLKHKSDSGERIFPSITTITCFYNEQSCVEEKLNSLLSLDYPRVTHMLISDGSSDNTNQILEAYKSDKVRVICLPKNVGKTMCQNIAAEFVNTELMVFSDANTLFDTTTLVSLVQPFRTASVGCTTGKVVLKEKKERNIEALYWNIENRIKAVESWLYSTVGATGGLYAVRSKQYVLLPQESISDFIEPLSIAMNGYLTRFVPEAIAYEDVGKQKNEGTRKKRILTRSLQSIVYILPLLNPFQYPYFSLVLWSHKILRWLSSILVTMLGILLFFIFPSYIVLFVLIYVSFFAILHIFCRNTICYRLLTYVHSVYRSSIIGWYTFLTGKKVVTWNTRRS